MRTKGNVWKRNEQKHWISSRLQRFLFVCVFTVFSIFTDSWRMFHSFNTIFLRSTVSVSRGKYRYNLHTYTKYCYPLISSIWSQSSTEKIKDILTKDCQGCVFDSVYLKVSYQVVCELFISFVIPSPIGSSSNNKYCQQSLNVKIIFITLHSRTN